MVCALSKFNPLIEFPGGYATSTASGCCVSNSAGPSSGPQAASIIADHATGPSSSIPVTNHAEVEPSAAGCSDHYHESCFWAKTRSTGLHQIGEKNSDACAQHNTDIQEGRLELCELIKALARITARASHKLDIKRSADCSSIANTTFDAVVRSPVAGAATPTGSKAVRPSCHRNYPQMHRKWWRGKRPVAKAERDAPTNR
jgi:hypothetical protein